MDKYEFLLKDNRYKIIRMFKDENISNKIIKKGLTLEQAQKHCNDGHWFDGYTTY